MPSFLTTSLIVAAAVSQPVLGSRSPFSSNSNDLAARDLVSEAKALLALKSKVTQDPYGVLSSWNVSNDVCTWGEDTISCAANPFDGGKLALAGINLNQAELDGDDLNLDFLTELTDLTFFHANSNNFKGTLPSDLSGISYLYELDVSNNQLSGPFPEGALTAVNLTMLDLRFNNFEGPIPAEVFNMDLDVLFLNDNQFSGEVPSNIGDTPALYLTLANNGFTGSIPASLGEAANLEEALLGGNQFNGFLPEVWTGPQNLTVLDVTGNQLIGGIPEALCELTTLEVLNVTGNYFTQPLGTACAKLEEAGVLDVADNCIPGLENQKSTEVCALIVSH
ncbi:hypothetical protein N0V93_008776 [Gnomoniopsis smithogilvyi]|uniref:Cell wall hydroxyproline-rich glycoprotein n=1 Tax=Gnomoniopsis smithogilvyi TaxID=1191159 RepID=A0A9W8YNN8_9PEZI|nr:hypothetical protein N0V93_008776 [Gnomoniopsis smithogilvyi]